MSFPKQGLVENGGKAGFSKDGAIDRKDPKLSSGSGSHSCSRLAYSYLRTPWYRLRLALAD